MSTKMIATEQDVTPPMGSRLRAMADEAWGRGSKELSGMLHDAARLAESEEDVIEVTDARD